MSIVDAKDRDNLLLNTMNPMEKKSSINLDLEAAYRKALNEKKELSVNPAQFTDIYSEEVIKNDLRRVAEMEVKFQKEKNPEQDYAKKIAGVFEAIINAHAEQSEWLGPNAMTIQASRYDDIFNGTDIVAKFDTDDKVLEIAIDVTTSEDVAKKIKQVKDAIDSNQLTDIKYFSSEEEGEEMHAGLKNIPRVVIGAEYKTINELMELWLNGQNKELGQHPYQIQILEEVAMQLKAFRDYAQKVNKDNLAKIFDERLGLIQKILEEKSRDKNIKSERFTEDKAFWGISEALQIFK